MIYHYDYADDCMTKAMKPMVAESYCLKEKLSFREEKNATVLPLLNVGGGEKFVGGVVTATGVAIPDTGFHRGKEGLYEVDKGNINVVHKKAIYLGYLSPVWGHCITDDLKLMWFALTPEFKKLQRKGYVAAYLCGKDFRMSLSLKKMLTSLGIDVDNLYRIDRPTMFDSLVVPQGGFIADEDGKRWYSHEYKSTLDHIINILQQNGGSAPKKIYLSRTHLSTGGRDIGEKDIERVFHKMGYSVVYPERLTLEEQISLYHSCDEMAVTEGSISHNAVFMHDGARLTIIRKVPFINQYQLAINEMRDLEVTYIDANLSVFVDASVPAAGPFFLYINDNVCRFSGGIVKDNFSLKRFRKYAGTALLLPHFERRVKMPQYYYEKLSEEIESKKNRWRGILRSLPLSEGMKQKIIGWGKKILR